MPRRVEAVIASFGGVGTTFLLAFAADRKPVNCAVDGDGLKHSPLPPISLRPDCRFLYLHGSPQLAAVSLFRRELHHYHSGKLHGLGRGVTSPIPREMTVAEYAAQGVDRFHFREHFANWYSRYPVASTTMFVRYEALFENLERVFDFLEMPRDWIASFPEKRSRRSGAGAVSRRARAQLDAMYGDFADELAQLDDVEVRPGADHRRIAGRYLAPPYLKAYAKQGAFEVKALTATHAPKLYSMLRNALR